MFSHDRFWFLMGTVLLLIFVCTSCDSSESDEGTDDEQGDDDDETDDDSDANCEEGIPIEAGTSGWTDAKPHLAFGDTLAVTVSGEISLESKGEKIGPDGVNESCGLDCPAPELNKGALIGKIEAGSKSSVVPFAIGSEYEQLTTEAGNLFLMVNDDSHSDNEGRFCADVDVLDPNAELPEQCLPENYVMQVIEVEYGTTAGFGQPFVPDNVLGPPAGTGGFASQSNPNELLSLGDGGYIIVKMSNKIEDGPGVDFVVFENMMYWGGNFNNAYTEAAVVDVSQDGQDWHRFSFDFIIDGPVGPQGFPGTVPDNFIGFAGIAPTFANCDPDGDGNFDDMIDPLDPLVSGGDLFDLADVGLDWAAYIRITDTGHIDRNPGSEMYDNDGDLINDGGNTLAVFDGIQGFDLDAIAIVNGGEKLEPDTI